MQADPQVSESVEGGRVGGAALRWALQPWTCVTAATLHHLNNKRLIAGLEQGW